MTLKALALLTLVLQVADLASGVAMIHAYGLQAEQNPIARGLFIVADGPWLLVLVKLGVVAVAIVTVLLIGLRGRRRLARNALCAAALLGLLGWSSNLV